MSIISRLRAVATLGRGITRGLPESSDAEDPITMFQDWLNVAESSGILLPEAATLATSSPEGAPSARMVLLKSSDKTGFVFYTNYESRKASDLEANPRAAMVFFWPVLQRQVRLEGGTVTRLSHEESDVYFQSRARGSQIGAWASRQSQELSSREELTKRVKRYKAEFDAQKVPLPEFWGGYRLMPDTIEFWQGRADRLHDRLRFERRENTWISTRRFP